MKDTLHTAVAAMPDSETFIAVSSPEPPATPVVEMQGELPRLLDMTEQLAAALRGLINPPDSTPH